MGLIVYHTDIYCFIIDKLIQPMKLEIPNVALTLLKIDLQGELFNKIKIVSSRINVLYIVKSSIINQNM